jgi:hypothetical protein
MAVELVEIALDKPKGFRTIARHGMNPYDTATPVGI